MRVRRRCPLLVDRAAKIFPKPIIRGVQLSVGLLFCQLAWKLAIVPPAAFTDHAMPVWWLVGGATAVTIAALLLRRSNISLLLVALAHTATGMQPPFRSGCPPSSRRTATTAMCDPFAGSGSTLIAAERNKYRCIAIELSPSYCDVVH